MPLSARVRAGVAHCLSTATGTRHRMWDAVREQTV